MTLPNNITFVDIETTGGRASFDRIIEIGILRTENNKLVRTYQTLINPEVHISPFIENLTGISGRDLEDAPTFGEVIRDIYDILEDSTFVAHNVRFDYSFVKNEFARFGKSFSPKHFCTVKLSRKLFPRFKHHNLDSIIERFGFECKRRHRAFDDAKILWDFYQMIQKSMTPEKFQAAISFVLKRPSLPIHLKPEVLDTLPQGPGVYIFYASGDLPLYIGKSINIRDRVLSHFSNDHASGTEMSIAQEIQRIETIETAGELGALFKESTLVKQLQPLHNRKLRLKRQLTILKSYTNDDGYESVRIENADSILVDDLPFIKGIFRSKKQAKEKLLELTKKHFLCQKILGLESGKGVCFGYHLGTCHGACKKNELPVKYNIRVTEAFSEYRLKTWPFGNPIVIQEFNHFTQKKEAFVIDKWCFLGSCYDEEIDIDSLSNEYLFDLDTYKILVNYLFNPKNQNRIKPLRKLHHAQTPSYLSQNI